jgi:hypothetical protein
MAHRSGWEHDPEEVRGGEAPDWDLMTPPGEVLPDGVPLEPGAPWPVADDWIAHSRLGCGGDS